MTRELKTLINGTHCITSKRKIYFICFFAICLNIIIPLVVIADSMTYEDNTDRMGTDIQGMPIALNEKDECFVCAQKCSDTEECKAYTYVKANTKTNSKDKPLCYLKYGVPDASKNNDCISGIKMGKIVSAIPTSMIASPTIKPTILLDSSPKINNIEPFSDEFGPQLTAEEKFSIKGSNFGTDKSKIQLGFTKNTLEEGKIYPRIPPVTENLLYQISKDDPTLNIESDTLITANAPSNLANQQMWIWVYKEGAGNSNPIKVSFNNNGIIKTKDRYYWACGPDLNYDLATAEVEYIVNEMTGIVTFKAFITNCGIKPWKGTGSVYFGWDNGVSSSEKRIDFNSDTEILPGEYFAITKDLPFSSKNKYGGFEILISVTPDLCKDDDHLAILQHSYVTGEDLKNGYEGVHLIPYGKYPFPF